jgi:hypothetical protein
LFEAALAVLPSAVPAVAAPNQPKNFLRVIDIISSSASYSLLKNEIFALCSKIFLITKARNFSFSFVVSSFRAFVI